MPQYKENLKLKKEYKIIYLRNYLRTILKSSLTFNGTMYTV